MYSSGRDSRTGTLTCPTQERTQQHQRLSGRSERQFLEAKAVSSITPTDHCHGDALASCLPFAKPTYHDATLTHANGPISFLRAKKTVDRATKLLSAYESYRTEKGIQHGQFPYEKVLNPFIFMLRIGRGASGCSEFEPPRSDRGEARPGNTPNRSGQLFRKGWGHHRAWKAGAQRWER